MTNDTTNGPWHVRYTVWEKSDEACSERESGHTGEQKTIEGFYGEPTKIDCVNAIVYDLRGAKSKWELAYIDEIKPVERSENND